MNDVANPGKAHPKKLTSNLRACTYYHRYYTNPSVVSSTELLYTMFSSLLRFHPVQLKDDAGLDSKEVAEAFADVANAMLVSLSDRCVDIVDNKVQNGGSKMTNEEIESASATAVATLADFALSAADVFGKALPGDPIYHYLVLLS